VTASRETDLIARIARRAGLPTGRHAVLGIGDDCAIIRPRSAAEDWLFTTDLLLEDVHFRRSTHSPADLGHKTLARGLSDIAAMGGKPVFCLLSLAVSAALPERWIDAYYAGFLQLASRHQMPLLGGDLARADKIACDVVVCGSAPRGAALLRSGARPGDRIYVSGHLGGSARGLDRMRGAAWRRHLRPEPRVALGLYLRARASAAMDVSDGLSLDLWRLCQASGVSAALDAVPVFPGATLAQALHGGEDYELLFTVPPGRRIPPEFQGVPLTRIGAISSGRPPVITFRGKPLPPGGYDHFATPRGGGSFA